MLDFLIQRVTAVVTGLYGMCIIGHLVTHPDIIFLDWIDYFHSPIMQVFSTLALLSIFAHAWIGLWTVGTDYLQPRGFGSAATVIRLLYQAIVILVLISVLIWGLVLIWKPL